MFALEIPMTAIKHFCRSTASAIQAGALLLVFSQSNVWAQVSSAWGGLTPGPYTVGFQERNRYDDSRTYQTKSRYEGGRIQGERARPMQIWTWYPAKKVSRPSSMPYEQYVYLTGKEKRAGALAPQERKETVNKFLLQSLFAGIPAAEAGTLMQMKTAAVEDAQPQPGKFPVIVFGQGWGLDAVESPLAHSVICEYLASHGYIVAAVPYQSYPLPQSRHDLIGLEQETRDLEYLIASMHDFPNADHDRLGAIGFDYGGMAALLLTMQNTDVDAVVSMDSGIAFLHNTAVLKQSPYYNVANLRVPLMHITRSQAENGSDEDLSLFDQAKYSNTYLLRMKGMGHDDFTSYGMISSTLFGANDPTQRRKTVEYKVASRYILNFLDVYVKGNPAALSYLNESPEANGVPEAFLTVERKAAQKAPPTEREFVEILLGEGIQKAAAIYHSVRQSDPTCVMFKGATLGLLGHQFLQDGRINEAIESFKLNVEAYPQNGLGYDSLGDAYMRSGDKELAVQNYKKALELNPQDTNAVEMLKKLEPK